MVAVTWAPDALGHLASIHSHVRQFDGAPADRLIRRLQRAGDSVDRPPNRGRPCSDGTRELVTVPPYVIQYEVCGPEVVILAVRHSRQRPIVR